MSDISRPVIVFAGGGTAGHVNPLLATIAALKSTEFDFDPLVVGTSEGLESELVPAAGYELLTIPRLPMPRRPSSDLVRLPVKMRRVVALLRDTFQKRGVRLVVGFGGYVSTPVYFAAKRLGIPIVIHEQNARPGLANRVGSRYAAGVGLTFEGTGLKSKHGETRVVGLPLRPSILALAHQLEMPLTRDAARAEAAEFFGLPPSHPTVLITGGSLGAQRLNEVLPDALLRVFQENPSAQVIHLTGKGKDGPVQDFVTKHHLEQRYQVRDYLTEMHYGLALADCVVCRAGAATVAENTALAIPTLYVPLPIGNGEQALNARGVVEAEGAFLLDQKKLTESTAAELLLRLLDPEQNATMRAAAAQVGTTRGAENLCDLILTVWRETSGKSEEA
ncbi:UDP-N-acetylglucosamine--N-acetylmuramyl-(pentapeptide) pyrophosphoryl-undecaprenol N-acetylglucosamine transferase [Mobiluncus curtisii]|uniref:UDP-N-acetylglucosamine--N-acetylmuramyl- (pentapeptide) pyrophosphoryl-undecaprenol N-acetylglucosamine transferase n=1 Tax=Mobiluncus curtisii TaxID=2051 RepID=UPI0001E0CA78|nr:UDP-N-acetylglucosamine--N-acetylmuramyl-(pentapeptide) pyrophosphoryl-undecaprenol N-acetylglucosamine transferase [Mobiluncus curtisii]EFL94372.1 putative undecaprenyldiphospho-muramoylpentapeptide beta-N-acetylglucosaminyltransferase [Mobiluncus curtisii subsp. curtisii ATCC 35241]NMW42996.1 UDP-N-acetylglucosamine--N-acetylmuramyl-(pentapeptide) pyrophosphoryl-undecaprenol N-acetylglucosamine transferase [Mobiluncus curtisii]NMW46000.1 UDP-N-acetylglucosamine--N-acetylmuramyl-(pentapeptid